MDLQFAGYELKLRERQLIGPGGSVDLSSRSFDILVALLARPNEMIGKSDLFDAAWPGVVVEENTLQVHVSSLRRLLGPGYIATVHGRGYKYVGPMPQSVVVEAMASVRPSDKGNVPDYRQECIAREEELAILATLLGKHRITSIVGPGGVGKTTLAIEAAARQSGLFAGGVWLVDLAPVGDPAHVASTIGQTLGMLTRKSTSIENELAEYLRGEALLLVLDNCEHLLGTVSEVLKVLLARAPRVKVLATSQVPLGLPEEHVFKLATFKLPEPDEDWQASQAGRFFRHCSELVRKSLVVKDGNSKALYRLLETSRQFARDQLASHDEVSGARFSHAAYLRRLLRGSLDDWEKLTDRQWLEVYGPETENLRSALEWLIENSRWKDYADLCAVSFRLWLETGLYREGMSHCERALQALEIPHDPELDARLRLGYAELCRTDSLDQHAMTLLEPALQFYRDGSDPLALIELLSLKGFILLCQLRVSEANAVTADLDVLARDIGPSKAKARALVTIGINRIAMGESSLGMAKCEAGLAMHNATGNTRSGLRSRLFVGEVLHQRGDNARAIAIGKSLLQEIRAAGYKLELGFQLNNLVAYHLADGDVDRAREMLLEAVEFVARDDTNWHWCLLQNIAGIQAMTGDTRRAARLLGFVDRRFAGFSDGRQNTEAVQRTRIMEQLTAAIPPAELESLLREGEGLSPFEADYLANFSGLELDRAAS